MTDPEDIARRAGEIKARAEQIAADATDSQSVRDEIDRLDEELRQLDEERRRLDDDLADRSMSSERAPWADSVADVLSAATERVAALGERGWPWRVHSTVERSVNTDGVVPVAIENKRGSIKVRAGDTNVVTVSAELSALAPHLLDEIEVTAERDGDEVVIRATWPGQRRRRRARLIVTVPPGTAVRADTSGGSISVAETRGSAAVTTKGGSITISGTSGDAKGRTAGGSVTVRDHVGPVHVGTSGGSIAIAGHITDAVEATTSGGSISIADVDRATVTATTSGGSISVRGRLTGDSRVRTAGGSVTVSIPADSQLHVHGKANATSSDFAELSAYRGGLEGTLGDGSDGSLELRTSGGAVALKKT